MMPILSVLLVSCIGQRNIGMTQKWHTNSVYKTAVSCTVKCIGKFSCPIPVNVHINVAQSIFKALVRLGLEY